MKAKTNFQIKRRNLLKGLISLGVLSMTGLSGCAFSLAKMASSLRSRVRPGDKHWPSESEWDSLRGKISGQLLKPESPFVGCSSNPPSIKCNEAIKHIKNPYFLGDHPALTQTSGYMDAWTSQPSTYAVRARHTADIVAAVNFARNHNLRLVIKGGGHSYQGTSNAADSLLIWTRAMKKIVLHDKFVAQNCNGTAPQNAVSIGAGALWNDAYDAVTTKAGHYVQGGGCTTVGVAGLVQSGGFGSFSKKFGTAAGNLIEAEVVTADGIVRIANANTNPDLFWAIKGGGGGSVGVVTNLILRTHKLPERFGVVFGKIKAESDVTFKTLIAKFIEFYNRNLFNSHWGERVQLGGNNTLELAMVFQGLNKTQVDEIWGPFFKWIRTHKEYVFKDQFIINAPMKHAWDPDYIRKIEPELIVSDDREGAPKDHFLWGGDQEQVGQFLHGYQSAWMPKQLLSSDSQSQLVNTLFNASRIWSVGIHFNKGLAGAPKSAIDAARDTAMNPTVLDAFALIIIGGHSAPEFQGMTNQKIKPQKARANAVSIRKSMNEILKLVPNAGAYVSESDYFQSNWQTAYWGKNYPRLEAVKKKYDPKCLFFVHNGVGSESWSKDGFTPLDKSKA